MTNNDIFLALQRKETIAQAAPARHTNIARAAASLSRRNVDQAVTELLNEALARLVALCYERDDSGVLCNLDPATGRVLIPLPWGKMGYAKWGLTQSEGDTFRNIMFTRQALGLPLFYYDRSRRAWFVNLVDYADGAHVLAQLREWEVRVEEYRRSRAVSGR